MSHAAPSLDRTAFNCNYCHVFAHQEWYSVGANRLSEPAKRVIEKSIASSKGTPPKIGEGSFPQYSDVINGILFTRCANCQNITVWVNDTVAYPQSGSAPPANSDMSDSIRRDYDEASSILDRSPRGAAALIRLAIEKLCGEIGDPKKTIDQNIKQLVADGLDTRTQRALDAVRVIGNNAVHPGQIDLTDDRAMAESLFKLLNLIVDKVISEPKHIEELYASLPKGALEHIERRDQKIRQEPSGE